MRGTLFDLGDDFADDLSDCPNPKPTRQDKQSFGRVANLYTAFSSEFAKFAIEFCLERGHRRIADPFAGMGTLAEAARTLPVKLRLNDLNPYAVLACAVRCAAEADVVRALDIVERLPAPRQSDTEFEYFQRCIRRITDRQKTTLSEILSSGLRDGPSQMTAVALFALATSRIALHKRFRGSNPTWIRRAEDSQFAHSRIASAISSTVTELRRYARIAAPAAASVDAQITWSDVAELKWRPGSVDAIVTSPPYPNRTDYIRQYLPGAELLIAAAGDDERSLRERQIGTPLIRGASPAVRLPPKVSALIERVKAHPSYASERYYYTGFLYYFADMTRALKRFEKSLAEDGCLIAVVQDTYYKDMFIPVADLYVELARVAGFKLEARNSWRVKQSLSRLSPHSRRSATQASPNETVLLFNK